MHVPMQRRQCSSCIWMSSLLPHNCQVLAPSNRHVFGSLTKGFKQSWVHLWWWSYRSCTELDLEASKKSSSYKEWRHYWNDARSALTWGRAIWWSGITVMFICSWFPVLKCMLPLLFDPSLYLSWLLEFNLVARWKYSLLQLLWALLNSCHVW